MAQYAAQPVALLVRAALVAVVPDLAPVPLAVSLSQPVAPVYSSAERPVPLRVVLARPVALSAPPWALSALAAVVPELAPVPLAVSLSQPVAPVYSSAERPVPLHVVLARPVTLSALPWALSGLAAVVPELAPELARVLLAVSVSLPVGVDSSFRALLPPEVRLMGRESAVAEAVVVVAVLPRRVSLACRGFAAPPQLELDDPVVPGNHRDFAA